MLTTGYNNYFNPQVLPIITTDIIFFLDDKMCFFYNKMWGGGNYTLNVSYWVNSN